MGKKIGRNSPCPCGSGLKYKHCCRDVATETVDALRETLQQPGERFASVNAMPEEDFDGLTPDDMHQLLYDPFSDSGVVRFSESLDEPVDAPALTLLAHLLDSIPEQGVKVTDKGNLPRQLCWDVAAAYWSPRFLEWRQETSPICSETDFMELHAVRLVAEMAGFLEKRGARLFVSRATRQVRTEQGVAGLYRGLFRSYATEFNWGYEDRFPELFIIQRSFGFALYLLKCYGDRFKLPFFYADRFVDAFPAALEEFRDESLKPEHEVEALAQAYQLRCINRFLDFFGLIEWEDGDKSAELARFRRSALFDRFVVCR